MIGNKDSLLEAAVKLKAEIRHQLKLLMDAWKQVMETKQLAEVQRVFWDEIGKVVPEARMRIIERLKTIYAITFGMPWELRGDG